MLMFDFIQNCIPLLFFIFYFALQLDGLIWSENENERGRHDVV